MKRNKLIIKLILCFVGACTMVSCFEDEGNYDYVDLPEFYVDTVGVQTEFTVVQHTTLSISPNLVYSGDKSELTYAWSIYQASSGQYDNPADTISTSENLNAVISNSPGTYNLEFCAIRPDGYKSFIQYVVVVEGKVGTGQLVLYERNGQADIDLIRSKRLVGSLVENSVQRNLYTSMNADHPLYGTPVGMSVTSSYVSVFTSQDGVRLYSEDLSHQYDFEEMFYTAPDRVRPQAVHSSNHNDILVNDGLYYVTLMNWSGGMPLYPSPKVVMNGDYECAPFCCETGGYGTLAFDQKNQRFLTGGMYSSEFTPSSNAQMTNLDVDIIALLRGYTGFYTYTFMQERSNALRRLLITSGGSSVISNIDLMSCPEIEKAKYFATNLLSPVFFYATDSNLYRVIFDQSTSTATPDPTPSWSVPAGEEITLLKMVTDDGVDTNDNPANKTLFVATWNGSEGKVYLLNANLTSGEIDPEPIEEYSGFGRIYEMRFKSR